MPTVGKTKFDYTPQGIQKARAWAEMTGKPMKMEKNNYQTGGFAGGSPNLSSLISGLTSPSERRDREMFQEKVRGRERYQIPQARQNIAPRPMRQPIRQPMGRPMQGAGMNRPMQRQNIAPPMYQQGGLASKGRFGDTKMRKVNGELSHVNRAEAGMIDKFGGVGEKLTTLMGSGDINPETGRKEYFWGALASWFNNLWNTGGSEVVDDVVDEVVDLAGETVGALEDISSVSNPSDQWITSGEDAIIGEGGFFQPEFGEGETTIGDYQESVSDALEDAETISEAWDVISPPEEPGEPGPSVPGRPDYRAKPWFWTKGREEDPSQLQSLITQMLEEPVVVPAQTMQMGGPVNLASMPSSRRRFGYRPTMQTSTAGMPMRGRPQFKKGGSVKYHV